MTAATLTRPPTTMRFEARGAVADLMKCRDPEVLLSGAAGTGKSVGALFKMHLTALQAPQFRGLILRKTHSSLTASTLVTFRTKVAAEAIAIGALKFYGGSAQEPASFKYRNGAVIVVGGLDRPTRLLSTEYDMCLIDEAIETTAEDLDTIVTRLRNGKITTQQMILATNPGAPSHHLKQRVDAGRTRIFYSTHEDNPRMHDGTDWTDYGKQYLNRLDSLTGARYQRMRWGKWVAAEGLVYEDWNPAVHMPVDRLPEGSERWDRIWGIDFGYSNPFVLLCFAIDPDGRLWLYRQMYMSKRLVEDHAKKIKTIVQRPDGTWREPPPIRIVADHDAEDRQTFQRHFGMGTAAAHKTVSDGVQAMQSRLKVQADGNPRFFVVRNSLVELDRELADSKKPTCFEDEISGYVWPDEGKQQDKRENPVKEDDHAMDTARYVIANQDLKGRTSLRWL